MKQNYNSKYLSKKQRHMKKWIPNGVYCHGYIKEGEYKNSCPFWYNKTNEIHNRKDCCFNDVCDDNCLKCNERISYCAFLKYIEYGQYPLGDKCKICGIRDEL